MAVKGKPGEIIDFKTRDKLAMDAVDGIGDAVVNNQPFVVLLNDGMHMHGNTYSIVELMQKGVNELNKWCLANEGKDFNEIAQIIMKRKHNLVPDQEVPDNSKVNDDILKKIKNL